MIDLLNYLLLNQFAFMWCTGIFSVCHSELGARLAMGLDPGVVVALLPLLVMFERLINQLFANSAFTRAFHHAVDKRRKLLIIWCSAYLLGTLIVRDTGALKVLHVAVQPGTGSS